MHGDVKDAFALMMHDRLIELERVVADLKSSVDPRLRLLGTRTKADTSSVFVRVRSSTAVAVAAWAARVLAGLGRDGMRWDVWACQHWTFAHHEHPFVTEVMVQQSGGEPVDVAMVGHVALDASPSDARVEAAAVMCPEWFEASILSASPTSFCWDPLHMGMVTTTTAESPRALDPVADKTWTLLHGYLAHAMDVADVWHPKALNASSTSTAFVALMTDVIRAHTGD